MYAKWGLEGNYSITYILDGGTNNSENPTYYNVESETIILQNPSKDGYIFNYWQDSTGTIVTEIKKGSTGDIILTANWISRTDIPYTVEHYKQNIDGKYILFETENKTGTTNTETLVSSKTYEGFTAKPFEQQTILPNGSTVVRIYYDIIGYNTATNIAAAISALTTEGPHDIIGIGAFYQFTISDIKTALKDNTVAKVNLDLSRTTGLTSLATSAFDGCSSLTSIDIPASVTSIGERAFEGCDSLTSIDIPASVVTSIGFYAFRDCSSLTSIDIPAGVTSIGESAFNGCSNLATVTIPESSELTSIGYCAFSSCRSLTSIDIPAGVTSIDNFAFSGCSRLTSIIIPAGVTSIGMAAFSGCSSLTTVNYTGTKTEWNVLLENIGSNNDCLINATKNYNYTE